LHPRKRVFATGVSTIIKKQAHEERILAEALPFIVNGLVTAGSEHEEDIRTIINTCVAYNDWRAWLAFRDHTEATLEKLDVLGKNLMRHLMKTQDVTNDMVFSRSIKVHHTMHWTQCIRRFGCTSNYNSETFESAHKVFVKSVAGVVSQRWKHGGIMSMLRRECRKRALGICFPKSARLNAQESNLREVGLPVEDLGAYLQREYDLEINEDWDAFTSVPNKYGAAWSHVEKCWLRPGHALQWVSPTRGTLS
jgi:hypothetical protein